MTTSKHRKNKKKAVMASKYPILPKVPMLLSGSILIFGGVCTIVLQIVLMTYKEKETRPDTSMMAPGLWGGVAAVCTGIMAILAQVRASQGRLITLLVFSLLGLPICMAAVAVALYAMWDTCEFDFSNEEIPLCDEYGTVWLTLNLINAILGAIEIPFYCIVGVVAIRYFCCPPNSKRKFYHTNFRL